MKRILPVVLVGLLGGLAVGRLSAQTFIWIGTGAGNSVITAGNWQGGVAPSGSTADTLIFGDAATQSVHFPASRSVGNLVFNGTMMMYQLQWNLDVIPTLTLAGGISTSPASMGLADVFLPISLTAGSHTFNIEGAGVFLKNTISGTGAAIVKSGAGDLFLGGANMFSGGATINAGNVYLGSDSALGGGTVTFNSGTLIAGTGGAPVTLANNFILGVSPAFGTPFEWGSDLTITGSLTPLNTAVNLKIQGPNITNLNGSLLNAAGGATAYTFFGGGNVVLGGNNLYSGGTAITDTQVFFATAGSIPASGLIQSSLRGYAGLGATTAVATFLGKLDTVNFRGTVGFDTPLSFSSPQVFPVTAPINLSAFAHSGVRVGTYSSAILTAEITPPATATSYNFGGAGWLFLRDQLGAPSYPLTGSRGLSASTVTNDFENNNPFMLVLSRPNNTYTGSTIVSQAGVIFDAAAAVPPGLFNTSQPNSYVGYTEAASISPAAFIGKLGAYDPTTVVGFDSTAHLLNRAIPGSVPNPAIHTVPGVDLSSLAASVYLGTSTYAIINGPIQTASNNTKDYYFTGYSGGVLTVDTALSGTRKVFVGLPSMTGTDTQSEVALNLPNSYSGGTFLQSGALFLGHNNSLGTGALTVDSINFKATLRVGSSVTSLSNPIHVAPGELWLQVPNPSGFVLSGNITGNGYVSTGGGFTISGNNSFFGGLEIFGNRVTTGTTNTAFGNGPIYLGGGASLTFTSPAPVVGGFGGGWDYDSGDGIWSSTVSLAANSTLTINQAYDDDFAAMIIGNGARLVKSGAGTLTLFGNNGYNGGTTISQGRLVAGAADAFGSNTVTLNGGSLGVAPGIAIYNNLVFTGAGSILGGGGGIGSAVAINSAVALSPGDSPGTLTFTNALTWAPGGSYNIEVLSAGGGVPGGSYDTIVVAPTGSFTITANVGGTFSLNLISLSNALTQGNVLDFNSGNSYSWQIASSSNAIGGFAPGAFNLNLAGFTNSLNGGVFSVSLGTAGGSPTTGNTAIFLNFTPVPEPSTWVLMLGGLGTLVGRWIRRRR